MCAAESVARLNQPGVDLSGNATFSSKESLCPVRFQEWTRISRVRSSGRIFMQRSSTVVKWSPSYSLKPLRDARIDERVSLVEAPKDPELEAARIKQIRPDVAVTREDAP